MVVQAPVLTEHIGAAIAFSVRQWRQSSVAPVKDRNNNKRPPNKGINRFACMRSHTLYILLWYPSACLSVFEAQKVRRRSEGTNLDGALLLLLLRSCRWSEAAQWGATTAHTDRRAVNDSLALPCKWKRTVAADRNGLQTTTTLPCCYRCCWLPPEHITFDAGHKKRAIHCANSEAGEYDQRLRLHCSNGDNANII